jgi:hypothetical protein
MTAWTPIWRVKVAGYTVTDVTISNLSITSGRTDIYSQPVAGYCNVQLINKTNAPYSFDVGTGLTIEVKNSAGTYVPIFGGFLSDYGITVNNAGSLGYTTIISLTALGALSRLPKILDTGVLSKQYDGDQIYNLLTGYLLGAWDDLSASQTWATYNATEKWNQAVNLGLGEIDRPGTYDMIARSSSTSDLYSLVSQIAQSAFGYVYEDSNGNIGYATTTHRQDYLTTNGYVSMDANTAIGKGIAATTRAGDIRNKIVMNYGNNANNHYTYENTQSEALYGVSAQQVTSSIYDTTDAQAVAQRYIGLRAFPYPKFEAISFPLGNPELTNTQRDALIGIFMGMPVDIQNLPINITGGSFQGFVEGWTFQASFNDLRITFNASPVNASLTANKWENVIASEHWNTLSSTMDWLNATVVA